MGTKIDDSIKYFTSMSRCYLRDYEHLSIAVETMRKYQHLQANYENRLKADMVAMLTELQTEIQKFSGCSCSCSDGIVDDIDDIIQQKIDALKGEQA